MNQKIVFMFSGQGSQYYQMGKELYEKNARFRLWMNHCDEIFREYAGISIIDAVYQQGNKSQLFDNLLQTTPALFAIEYSLGCLLIEAGIKPDFVLGYSIGELVAATLAGVVSLEDGAKLAIDYARLVEECGPKGAMIAVMESGDQLNELLMAYEGVWIAGKNFGSHCVISGLQKDIETFSFLLDKRKSIYQRLPVKYAFHTPVMDPLQEKFNALSQKADHSISRIPIISPVLESPTKLLSVDHMWRVVSLPVNFQEKILKLIKNDDFIFIDVGPSGTLATFVKYLLPKQSGSIQLEVMNQFGRDVNVLHKVKEHFSFAY